MHCLSEIWILKRFTTRHVDRRHTTEQIHSQISLTDPEWFLRVSRSHCKPSITTLILRRSDQQHRANIKIHSLENGFHSFGCLCVCHRCTSQHFQHLRDTFSAHTLLRRSRCSPWIFLCWCCHTYIPPNCTDHFGGSKPGTRVDVHWSEDARPRTRSHQEGVDRSQLYTNSDRSKPLGAKFIPCWEKCIFRNKPTAYRFMRSWSWFNWPLLSPLRWGAVWQIKASLLHCVQVCFVDLNHKKGSVNMTIFIISLLTLTPSLALILTTLGTMLWLSHLSVAQ